MILELGVRGRQDGEKKGMSNFQKKKESLVCLSGLTRRERLGRLKNEHAVWVLKSRSENMHYNLRAEYVHRLLRSTSKFVRVLPGVFSRYVQWFLRLFVYKHKDRDFWC